MRAASLFSVFVAFPLALFSGIAMGQAPAGPAPAPPGPNTPYVEIETTSVMLGVGGQSGEGTLFLPNL